MEFVPIGIKVIVLCGAVVLCRMERVGIVIKFWRPGVWFNASGDQPFFDVYGGIFGVSRVMCVVCVVLVVVFVVKGVGVMVAPFICTHGTFNLCLGAVMVCVGCVCEPVVGEGVVV